MRQNACASVWGGGGGFERFLFEGGLQCLDLGNHPEAAERIVEDAWQGIA